MKIMQMPRPRHLHDFQKNGSEVQAMFDASATCEGPNASDSYQFYPDPDDEA